MKRHSLKDGFASFSPTQRRTGSLCRAARLAEVPPIVPEALEARRLYAVTASVSGSVLTVWGDANANDIKVFQIHFAIDEIGVRVAGVSQDLGPFYANVVNSIVVHGGSGDDILTIDNSVRGSLVGIAVSKPTTINGDYGDDTIWGSDQPDTISGNYGSDTVRGAGGNDLIYGGYGDDTDTADDDLRGDSGNDTIYGEGGVDFIAGDDGADSLFGGAGNDLFDASGDGIGVVDYIDGGAGSDDATDRDGNESLVSVEYS